MIKGSKTFLIISFAIAFGLAFYFANKMYPVFGNNISFVTVLATEKNKTLPLKDEFGNVLEQIIAFEPNQVQLVYKIPNIEGYKVDIDSVKLSLEEKYQNPSKKMIENLQNADQDLKIEYLFKDKNETKLTSFKKDYTKSK
nr:hypothetical protein [uncultured Flavobacterium sp.]